MLLTCSLRTEDEDTGDDMAGRRPLLSSFLSPAFFCSHSQDALPLSLSICFCCFFSLFFSGPSSLCICLFVRWFSFFLRPPSLSVLAPCPPVLFLVLYPPCVFFVGHNIVAFENDIVEDNGQLR
jgi:hypothetical protein